MENKFTTEEEVDIISKGLDTALEFGLEVEVIYQALQAMKADPTQSPAEAFIFGVTEWVK
jgi:predicted RNA methylase